MLHLFGYEVVEEIYQSVHSIIYRAIRTCDNQLVILKMLNQEYPTPAERARYRHEYEIIQEFYLTGIIKAYDIEEYQNTLVLILEDFGAVSLQQMMVKHLFTLKEFLVCAIQVAGSLGDIHAAQLIHKDISPDNIVMNPQTGQLKIIDFGLASRLPRENPVLKNPEQLAGTLAYLSPEQTGRINRRVDYRTDLYSMGATFYEVLTGRLPCTMTDALEVVHCHIAKTPPAIFEVHPETPRLVSDIVMKLLEKNADDRYQSAAGVKADLQKCLENLPAVEDMRLSFALAQNDFSGQLQVPQKLYGRKKEEDILLQSFERVSHGATEMMLVTGYSGTGKTALVHEIYAPMTKKRGYFATGKFDQFQKNIPYSAITQAFNGFCRYLLLESAETLLRWQEKILAAVGKNGHVIIDVIPDLELLIGKQPVVAQVGPTEAQNRFNMFFVNFVKSLSDKRHPFILFIDDLQWVDSASLGLLKSIMLDDEMMYLMIIGAYRNNEVKSGHPLLAAVDELHTTKSTKGVHTIELENLQHADIKHLLKDSLQCQAIQTQALTDLIYQKTQGNAFFTHQFLQILYEERLLYFDFKKHQWQWNIEQIASEDITDNVVDLLAQKINKMPEKTVKVLQLAACIGNQFELSMLAFIYEKSEQQTLSDLQGVLAAGFIHPVDENYKHFDSAEKMQFKFSHDRVQQAAYALIDDEQKQVVHLQLGRLLLRNIPIKEREGKIFDIVGQFNQSLGQVHARDEQLEIARLNLLAGQKAKTATAYEAASQYLKRGIACLPKGSWQKQYQLSFELYKQAGECEYLLTHIERSEKLFRLAVDNARTDLEKAEIYAMQIMHSLALSRLDEAIERGRTGLHLCGIHFPATEQVLSALHNESAQLANVMHERAISTLLDAPQMSDKAKIVAMRIFPNVAIGSYLSGNNELFQLSALMGTNISLTYGQLDLSAYIYSWYGVFLSTQGKLKEAYEFGKLALEISDKYPNCRERTQTHNVIGTFILHLNQHVKDSLPVLLKGYRTGFEIGDVLPALYCFFNISVQMFASGKTLAKMLEHINKVVKLSYKNNVLNTGDVGYAYRQLIQFLITGDDQYGLSNDFFNKEQVQRITASNSLAFIMHLRLHKAFWFGDYVAALEIAQEAQQTLNLIPGYFLEFEHYFIYPLVLAGHYPQCSPQEQEAYIQEIESCEEKMKIWATSCQENFLHRYLLIVAEKNRIIGNDMEALHLYDQAIQSAKEGGFTQNAALANELAAAFWLSRKKENFVSIYLKEAYYLYEKWGATAKNIHLEEKYPQFLPESRALRTHQTTMTGSHTLAQLDLTTVMRASQALAGEVILNKLLKNMMRIVIENAGAERGLLLLPRHNTWFIETEGHVKHEEVRVLQSLALEEYSQVPRSFIYYIARTQEHMVLAHAAQEGDFNQDSYIVEQCLKSILGMPLLNQGKLSGILYLENNLIEGAFTPQRLEVLTLLSSQMAVSIENSLLYNDLERKVEERTRALRQEVAERQRAVEAAKFASKAKSDFLAAMSHELRTPLNAIVGFSQLLERDPVVDGEQLEEVQIISRSGQHLLGLINGILDMAKVEAGRVVVQKKTFDLYAVLRTLSELFHHQADEKDLFFLLEEDTGLPRHIRGDEDKLRQTLINLLGNALKFTEKGGITLRVRSENRSENRSDNTVDAQRLHFEVEDTGIGIDPEDSERIFAPFIQTKDGADTPGGTGLGLTISRQFARLMGGDIEVTRASNGGTIFRFYIEVEEAKTAEVKENVISRQVIGLALDQADFRILVVEDIRESRQLLVKLLRTVGFEVREAANGKQGVQVFESWNPDLIWMDMSMPVMDGYAATREIKAAETEQETVIIALSAHAFEDDRQKILNIGCDDFISKPYVEEELFAAMEKHLGVVFVYEELPSAENSSDVLTAEKIAELPREIRTSLREAALELDQQGCFTILEQLRSTHPEIVDALRTMAENYRFEELENIFND